MSSRRQLLAWGLVLAVLASWCLAALAVVAGVAPAAVDGRHGSPLTGAPAGTGTGTGASTGTDGGRVVLLGVPGLTWDLVDAGRTPTLADLAAGGGAAALVVRGTHEATCPADAWLTIGAGQRAATDVTGCGDADGADGTDGAGDEAGGPAEDGAATGVDPEAWVRWQDAAARRALAPELGSLAALAADAGTCVSAEGQGAVIGAAGPTGEVTEATDGRCRIHLVATEPVEEGDRTGSLAGVDRQLADLRAALPEDAALMVATTGHTAGRPDAGVLVVDPVRQRDGAGASLSSGSTRQRGLVQLTDLTPTLLSLAGVPVPGEGSPLAGQPVTATAQVGDHVAQARDVADGISDAKRLVPWTLGALAALVLPPLAVALLLRARRPAAVLATVAMAVPVATFTAGLVPWWRAEQPWPVLVVAVLAGAVLVGAVAWAGPWRRDPLGPAAVVAAVTAAVLGVDLLWSSRLGLVAVLGLQPVTAGRFYGQGNVGFGTLLGAVLVLMGAVLSWLPTRRAGDRPSRGRAPVSRWAAAPVAVLGLAATALSAAPQAGADFGGVPALVVATGLVVLAALGLRWSVTTLLAVAAAAALVAGAVMVLDWLRGPEERTHLGTFVQSVLDGEAGGVVARKLDQSLGILVGYPVSWSAVLALVLVALVVLRRPAWTAGLWVHPGLRPVALAGLVAMALTWALNDSGIAAVALCLTMLICAALTVLARSLPARRHPDGPVTGS